MNSLEKRHTGRRGSTHVRRKYADGFSDTSSGGSYMDETDREVSNLTDRAFRSLCIGEEAIYNDSEISSPTERHKAFAEEPDQKEAVKATCQETFSYGIQYGEAERRNEVASTFQQSCMDVFRDECLSYMSNGSVEATWQHRRSTSRVASLIKAFSSGEGYYSTADTDTALSREKSRDFNNDSWDKSALVCTQKDLPEISSAYQQNFNTGSFQSYKHYSHASAASVVQMHTAASLGKSHKINFKALNSTNFFFHSEFSPFQLWKDYNRFPFKREETSGFVSTSEFPRWYNTPLYKELTAAHRTSSSSSEGRWFNRRKTEDVAVTQRSRSTVIQKASAVEKRCESEITSSCPPWRKNNNFMRNKLPSNRPSTVSPTNEKITRADSSLFYPSRHAYEIQHKVGNVGDNEMSSNMIPFSITHLLTPVIHGRQETETSEILQFAHTPSVPDCPAHSDTDMKSLPDVKQLRDSYKAKASSLLFNIKDNRKRVKSTYSPPKCKSSEITDRSKQPPKLNNLESRLSDTAVPQMTTQEYSAASDPWELCNLVKQTYDVSLSQSVEHKEHADGSHCNIALSISPSQYEAANYKIPQGDSKGNSLHPNKLSNRESREYGISPHMHLAQNKTTKHSEDHIYKLSRTLSPRRPEMETVLSKVHPPVHTAQRSEKQTLSRREDVHYNIKEENYFVRKPSFGCTNNAEETLFCENPAPTNITNKKNIDNGEIKNVLPYKGEIAALIEMDKQRKANAKQYLPLAIDSYTMGKETYINKMNENIKQGRLTKEEEMKATEISSQKYPQIGFRNNPVQDHPANTLAVSQNVCEFQNPLNITTSPTKETNLCKGPENAHNKAVCLQRDNDYPRSDITSEKDYRQRTRFSLSQEEKHKNEGSVAYQPYNYEPNKQWYIGTSQNKQTKDKVCPPRQLQQTEKKSDKSGETNYSLSEASSIQRQSVKTTAQRTLITEDKPRTEDLNPNNSVSPKERYAKKLEDTNLDINKQNIQSTELNNKSSQIREDRFSINDILSIRDNEQAKRIRENKHSFSASEAAKLENQPSFISDITEDKEAKREASKMKEQGQNPCYKLEKTNPASAYIRKESHNPSEGLINVGTGLKEKSGKDTLMNNENDRITSKALFSYKERGQTKQEILTSKLKAHAQKEISAIKEKGLSKQSIPSRNPIKQNTVHEKGPFNQFSLKKEITAEKLDHLFQDITYSSVTSYKESRNQDNNGPKYESLMEQDMQLPGKNTEAAKDDKLIINEKENGQLQDKTHTVEKTVEFQDIPESYQPQPLIQSTENHFKCGLGNPEEQCTNASALEDIAVLNKSLSRSPPLISLNKEISVVKTDETATHQPTVNNKNKTEYLTCAPMGNDSSRGDLSGKIVPCKLTPCNSSDRAKYHDYSINKTSKLLSNVEVDKHTLNSDRTDQKCTNLKVLVEETAREKRSTREENLHYENTGKEPPTTEPSEEITKTNTRQVSPPSDLTKLKNLNLPVDPTMESTHTETGLPEHKASTTKDKENEVNCIDLKSPEIINLVYGEHIPETKEKSTQKESEQWAKQDIKLQADSTAKPNKDSLIWQLHHSDTPKLKACENAHTNKGSENRTISNSNKQECIQTLSAGVNECPLLKEPKENEHKAFHPEKNEIQQKVCNSKQKISSATERKSQQIQETQSRHSENQSTDSENQSIDSENQSIQSEHRTQMEKDTNHQAINAPNKKNEDESIEANSNSSLKPTEIEHEESQERSKMQNDTINNTNQKESYHSVNSVDIISPVPDGHIIHIPSKKDEEPVDEPVIYSIHVSSKSETVSEDEPVIFTICVSSMADTPKTDDTANHNRHSSDQEQQSVDGVERGEISGNIKEETVNRTFECKASEIKKEKVLLDNKKAGKENVVGKYSSPATKDKNDCYSVVDNISSSYEGLLEKYGLPSGDNIHLKSGQKEQDKMQEKEEKEPINDPSQKVQKTPGGDDHTANADYIKRHHQESRKKSQVPEFLKASEENGEQHVTHLTEEKQIASEESSQTAGGVMSTSEKNIKTEKQGILVKQKAQISNVVPVCECSQDTMSTTAQKTDVTNDNDGEQLEDKEKVKQKVQVMDSARHTVKETENDYGVNKKADIIVMKNMTDNQKTTNTSNSATVIDDHSYEGSCKHTPDAAPDHKRQKTAEAVKKVYSVQEECERDSIKVEILNTDTALTKDNKSSQNVVGAKNVGKNSLCEQEEIEFKIRREAKGKRDIILQNGNPTFTNVQTVKESQNVLEDQIKKLSVALKTDQILVKNLNMSFEEKNMPKMELELNKNIVKIQEKHLEDEQIKSDSTSARCVVLPKNPNENVQSTLAKVAVQKLLSTVDPTEDDEDDTKRLDNQKWKEEPTPTQGKNIKNEITPVNNKDTRETASSLIKDRNATECESNKNDNIVKDLIDQPQHKKEDNFEKVATDKVRRDSGQIKSKAHGLMVKDNSNIRGEMENSGENSQVKHDDRINVYQYYPGKGFLPETKGNKYDEPSSIVSCNHDAVFKKKDCAIANPDIIDREKKTTRPEISALADYARLRVISAEDDTTSEKELLQKMDTHHKYNLFGVEPQKGLQGNFPTPLGSAEVNTKKTYENQSQITKPLQIQERDNPSFQRSRITEEMLERYNEHTSMGEITPHSKLSSMTRSSDGRLFGFKETGSTRGKMLTNQTQPNKSLNEQLSGYPRYHGIHQSQNPQVTHSLLSQDKVNYGALSRLRQPVNSKMQNVYSHVKSPESLAQTSVGSQHNKKSIQTSNQKNVISQETNGGEKMEELQYYTVNARESLPKPKDLPEMLPVSHKTILKKEGAEIPVAKARSNSSSPAMGKPFMFKVKDNTLRTTSVTKTVKPHFRRSFSEEFRIGSPREMWRCSEKDEPEDNHELDLKEPACLPVQHEPAVTSHRLSRLREIRSQSGLSSAEVAATEPKSYLRRSQPAEDDDNRSVVSTLSEDVESLAASTIFTTDSIASHAFDNEHIRYSNARPASACFVRPESVCYERPESSCSDVRALGKPPSVPPKTEKALRRAKKLTTRRIKKTEATTPDSQGQVETKHIQNASTLPSSPLEPVSSHHTLQASPPISHYHVKPNFAPPAPSIVAHPFPVTQRKLLQDPNSGQYFMVDMPVQVKPKMFFDPATGKYVQLNVRQQPQSNVSHPPSVEVLNQPYIVYPGFLPMPVSSLPSLRSSSQMSAPATLMEVPNMVEANSGVQRQSNYNTNAQLYNEPVYRTHEQTGSESVCAENNVDFTQRKTDIITISELEDFAMEST